MVEGVQVLGSLGFGVFRVFGVFGFRVWDADSWRARQWDFGSEYYNLNGLWNLDPQGWYSTRYRTTTQELSGLLCVMAKASSN